MKALFTRKGFNACTMMLHVDDRRCMDRGYVREVKWVFPVAPLINRVSTSTFYQKERSYKAYGSPQTNVWSMTNSNIIQQFPQRIGSGFVPFVCLGFLHCTYANHRAMVSELSSLATYVLVHWPK
jgi:hypothetical protein